MLLTRCIRAIIIKIQTIIHQIFYGKPDMDNSTEISQNSNIRWDKRKLLETAEFWHSEMCKKYFTAGENSPLWDFNRSWNKNIENCLNDFYDGKYQFSPMKHYVFKDGIARMWCFFDRLIMHLIFKTLHPIFKHSISQLK